MNLFYNVSDACKIFVNISYRKEDAERVMAANLRKGPSYATLCLLMQVSTKSEDWFQGIHFHHQIYH